MKSLGPDRNILPSCSGLGSAIFIKHFQHIPSITAATNTFLHLQDFARNAAIVDRKISFRVYLNAQQFKLQRMYFGSLETFNTKVK